MGRVEDQAAQLTQSVEPRLNLVQPDLHTFARPAQDASGAYDVVRSRAAS